MKHSKLWLCLALSAAMTVVTASAGKGQGGQGYMGGDAVMKEAPTGGSPGGGEEEAGRPDTVEGPLGDHGSVQGELYGDLYVILRYQGGETKNVPAVDANGDPVMETVTWTDPNGNTADVQRQAWVTATAVGGEPILTENFVDYTVIDEDTGGYVINPLTDDIWFASPTPSQCVQPVANFRRWGDLSSDQNTQHPYHSALEQVRFNAIPLIMTYDPTWDRTEFTVGLPDDPVYFIAPGGTWWDPNNELVTYVDGVLWADLIQEVGFGRLNQARATEAVLQAAFDEAIRSLNAALAIRIDPSGRLLLRQYVYDEYLVDPLTGDPLIIDEIDKAIDSPLENLALYVKLMQDGHLVTPGDERDAIDRSEEGGIPIDLMLGLEDGPSTDLRPTIDIEKMRTWGLGHLVDVTEVTYYTYYEKIMEGETIVDYVLRAVTTAPADPNVEYQTWVGIPTDDGSSPAGEDFEFCAATLSAAADKGGKLTVDHVVYLNSILGINKVVGTSDDGTIDYAKNPIYFDYGTAPDYDRTEVFDTRGYYPPEAEPAPGGDPVLGQVYILGGLVAEEGGDPVPGVWAEFPARILEWVEFRELGEDEVLRFPNDTTAKADIAGFAQGADDNLSLIDFVHTFQVPANR